MRAKLCDGVHDCSDGSDEQNCPEGTTVESTASGTDTNVEATANTDAKIADNEYDEAFKNTVETEIEEDTSEADATKAEGSTSKDVAGKAPPQACNGFLIIISSLLIYTLRIIR